MTAVVRGDALHIPLRDESVDLIVTSPPYFALRSYRDGGEHYEHQIGSEPTPQAFLEALWAVTAELWRVLKPSGSLFVNLGDKRSGSGGHNNSSLSNRHTQPLQGGRGRLQALHENEKAAEEWKATRRNAPDRYNQAAFGRAKSKMLLPHRYAIGCEDGLADPPDEAKAKLGIKAHESGWIVRQDIVWSKPNGLPESVTDRVRDSHEYWFHMVKSPRYFAAVDEVREPSEMRTGSNGVARDVHTDQLSRKWNPSVYNFNPLGKLPGSVWSIPSEPLQVPDWLLLGRSDKPLPRRPGLITGQWFKRYPVDHFAAFPQEWPRRLILGWSPSGICTVCGEGRRPVVEKEADGRYTRTQSAGGKSSKRDTDERDNRGGFGKTGYVLQTMQATITGYACACPDTLAPTRPAVVFDPFLGTGTTIGVARALGRTGIGLDLSADYCRLASWRVFDSGHFSKTTARTHRENQGSLL